MKYFAAAVKKKRKKRKNFKNGYKVDSNIYCKVKKARYKIMPMLLLVF